MEALQSLPAWAQFFLALVVGGILLLLNIGWLMQARGWLEAAKEKQRQRSGQPGQPSSPRSPTAPPSVTTKPGG